MSNFLNATASTLLVACLALFAGRLSSPEPPGPQNISSAAMAPAATLGSVNQNQVLTEMLSTLGKINSRLESATEAQTAPVGSGFNEAQTASVGSGFDSGGSDGATNSPTWPTPNSPPHVTPATTGSGSTGNRLYSSQPVVTYYGSTSYGTNYGSNGGYSQTANYSNFSNSSGLFSRVRARTSQPVRTSARNVICVDGVCYPN